MEEVIVDQPVTSEDWTVYVLTTKKHTYKGKSLDGVLQYWRASNDKSEVLRIEKIG